MTTCDLTNRKCVPCEGGVPSLTMDEARKFLKEVHGWALADKQIEKNFKFKDFILAMKFVNKIAEVAEAEGHHPDIFIHYNQVKITLWTHAVNGLTENDFIVAAKIDAL